MAIPPSPGSAVVWFSSTSSLGLMQDSRTEHVGCPVAAGNKWAALKIAFKAAQWNRVKCGRNIGMEIAPLGN